MATVAAPTLTTQPDAPAWDECRDTDVADDIMGMARYTDPATLTDLDIAHIVDSAIATCATWHRLADKGIPTQPWKQLLAPNTHSGHKLHIACATFDDVRSVLARVFEVAWRAGMGCKAATSPVALERGKGVVVYLPRRATIDRDASLIARALDGYAPTTPVDILGSVHLTGALWWRHEFGGIDPGVDVWTLSEYRALYVPAPALPAR